MFIITYNIPRFQKVQRRFNILEVNEHSGMTSKHTIIEADDQYKIITLSACLSPISNIFICNNAAFTNIASCMKKMMSNHCDDCNRVSESDIFLMEKIDEYIFFRTSKRFHFDIYCNNIKFVSSVQQGEGLLTLNKHCAFNISNKWQNQTFIGTKNIREISEVNYLDTCHNITCYHKVDCFVILFLFCFNIFLN